MKNEILKAYKFRIYPESDQAKKLDQTFGCVRFLWNALVENFNNHGTPKFKEKFNEKVLKDTYGNEFLKDVASTALQQKRVDFTETKSQFFNKNRKVKLGRMKFKKKGVSRDSFRLSNHTFKLFQDDNLIQLLKIGKVPVIIDRKIPEIADYRSATVSKSKTGKYFVSVLVKIDVDLLPTTGKKVGIDLGLKDLFILSNGDVVRNPRWFRKNQTKLSKAQRHLSRKQKGSNRYKRQRMKVARIHEKIVNQRNYFLHNISTSLVRNFDVICVEDLNVSGMVKNHTLSKSISDASWSTFVSMLEYKCNWYGKSFVKIDRFYPSSQICSSCGHKDGKKELSVRSWTCSNCKAHHDRDLNAANNILIKGMSDLTGQTVHESAELVDYKRGEGIRLFDVNHHLAPSVKRLDST